MISSSISKPKTLSESLERAALEPEAWNDVCDGLAALVDASGTLILPFDVQDRNISMPRSTAMEEMLETFVSSEWARRDFRNAGFPRAITVGYVTDQDLISVDEMRKHPYYEEWLASLGLRWFAGFCFKADSKIWGAAVHGTAERGPFLANDIEKLMSVRESLSLAAKQSSAMGRKRIMSLEEAFAAAGRGVAVLDFLGRVAWMNAQAETMLRDAELISNNRLRSVNELVDRQLGNLVGRALAFSTRKTSLLSSPVLVPAREGVTISLDAFPMPRDFQSLLAGASALVTMHEVDAAKSPPANDLRARFKLTGREVELCGYLMAGRKLADAADRMGISVSTVRQHVKSIFGKTGTHSQVEVVALLSRLAAEPTCAVD